MPKTEVHIFPNLSPSQFYNGRMGTLDPNDDNRFKTITSLPETGSEACAVFGSLYASSDPKFKKRNLPLTTFHKSAYSCDESGEQYTLTAVLGEGDASHVNLEDTDFISDLSNIASVAEQSVNLIFDQLCRYESVEDLSVAINTDAILKFVKTQIDPKKEGNNSSYGNTSLSAFRLFRTKQGLRIVGFVIGEGALMAYDPMGQKCDSLHPIISPLKEEKPYAPSFPFAYQPHHVTKFDTFLPWNSLILTFSSEAIHPFITSEDGFKNKYESSDEYFFTFPFLGKKLVECLRRINEEGYDATRSFLFSILETVTQPKQDYLDQQPSTSPAKKKKAETLKEECNETTQKLFSLKEKLTPLKNTLPYLGREVHSFTLTEIETLENEIQTLENDPDYQQKKRELAELQNTPKRFIQGDFYASIIPAPIFPKLKLIQDLIQIPCVEGKTAEEYQNILDQIREKIHLQELHYLFSYLEKIENSSGKPFYSGENLRKAQRYIYQTFEKHQNRKTPPDKKIYKEEIDPNTLEHIRKLRIYFRSEKQKNPGLINRQGELKALKTQNGDAGKVTLWMTHEQHERFCFFKHFNPKGKTITNGEYESHKTKLDESKERSASLILRHCPT